MQTEYAIVRCTPEHIEAMLPNVRQADVMEIDAASGNTPREALYRGLHRSLGCWAGLADGEVVCIFGVAPLTMVGTKGVPWMLGTPLVEVHAREFVRRCRGVVGLMLEVYPELFNFVDCRNTKAIQWLKWLGFKIGEPEPYGRLGLPFRRFELCATSVPRSQ